MKMHVTDRVKVYQFESIDDHIRHAVASVSAAIKRCGSVNPDTFFHHKEALMRSDLSNWNDLQAALSQPWVEGIRIIEKLREGIPEQDTDFTSARRRRRGTSEFDGEVDFDRWIAGREDFYDLPTSVKVKGNGKFVSLAFTNSMPFNIKGVQAFTQAAAVVAAVDKLEAQGLQVELTLYAMAHRMYKDGAPDRYSTVLLKKAGDPVNVESIATGISPWFFRLVTLGSMCADKGLFTVDEGMGWPSYRFGDIKPYLPADAMDITRRFDLDGALQTFAHISSMVKDEGGSNDNAQRN